MLWNALVSEKKFLPANEFFLKYGRPKFKLGEKDIYYMGNGIFIGLCLKKFRIEGFSRIEYGELGEYLFNIVFFQNKSEAAHFYKLRVEEFDFEQGEQLGNGFTVVEEIKIGSTYDFVFKYLKSRRGKEYFDSGESSALNEKEEFVFSHSWVRWRNFDFYFFGKSKKTKMTGVNCILLET